MNYIKHNKNLLFFKFSFVKHIVYTIIRINQFYFNSSDNSKKLIIWNSQNKIVLHKYHKII